MRDLVVIHGAWQGAWVWDAIAPILSARGIRSHVVDLPGNGTDDTAPQDVSLDLYVDHVARVLAGLSGRAWVLGHSGGAITAQQVSEAVPYLVDGVVCLAGIMQPSGVPYTAIVRALGPVHPAGAGIVPHLVWSADGTVSSVPAAAAADIFLQDVERGAALAAGARLTPQSERGRDIVPVLTPARWGRTRRIYIGANQDRSILPAAQTLMQDLCPEVERFEIAAGHVPQVSRPAELAAMLDTLLR